MAQGDEVLDKADALMGRYRSFVAQHPQGEPVPDLEEDIPLLTEVVDESELVPQTPAALLDALQGEIEAELSAWLVEALPAAVTSASQHIIAELDAKARKDLLPRLQVLIEEHRQGLAVPVEAPPQPLPE